MAGAKMEVTQAPDGSLYGTMPHVDRPGRTTIRAADSRRGCPGWGARSPTGVRTHAHAISTRHANARRGSARRLAAALHALPGGGPRGLARERPGRRRGSHRRLRVARGDQARRRVRFRRVHRGRPAGDVRPDGPLYGARRQRRGQPRGPRGLRAVRPEFGGRLGRAGREPAGLAGAGRRSGGHRDRGGARPARIRRSARRPVLLRPRRLPRDSRDRGPKGQPAQTSGPGAGSQPSCGYVHTPPGQKLRTRPVRKK